MSLNFSTSNAEAKTSGVKMLVYAPAGHGKTMLAATLPKPIILSGESGLLSLNPDNQRRVYGGEAKDVPVIIIKSFAEFEEAYQFCSASSHMAAFDSIALDSISEIAEVALASFKRLYKDPRQAYGELNDRVNELIRKFRDIPNKHVYFSAKMDKDKDEVTGLVLNGPAMPGKTLTRDLPHFFDEVFYLGIGSAGVPPTPFRFIRTKIDPQFNCKDRSGALDELEKPDLAHIIAKIQSKK